MSLGPSLAVLVVGLATFDAVARFRESRAWVDHTRQVLAATQRVRTALVDMETGSRGYLLVGEPSYLEPYESGARALRADTATLRRLTLDNPTQQRRLDILGPVVRARVARLDSAIALRRAARWTGAAEAAPSFRGKALMDSARAVLDGVERDERRLLDARLAAEDRRARVVPWIVVGGTLAAVVLGLLANTMLARYAARQEADAASLASRNEQLHAQQETLEQQQTRLEQQAAELEAANEELVTANEELLAQREAAEAARREAELASRTKSDFLSAMSHELRTPLNAISGHVQLLEMGLHGPVTPEQRESLGRVGRAQQHLLGLINDILNFARIESGKLEYDLRPVTLREIVADVAPMIEPQLGAKGIAHEVRLADPALLVWADGDRARQVLLNLLANAVKFTDSGGRVTIESVAPADDGERVHLRVRDTGRGIPADQLDRIFEPFVQLTRGPGRRMEGTGLGLSISRQLARGMGGDLWAESEYGAGSVFVFALRRTVLDGGASTDRRTLAERREEEERRQGEDRRAELAPDADGQPSEFPGAAS